MSQNSVDLDQLTQREYPYGFATELAADSAPRGLGEDVIRLISSKKREPAFLLEWRLRAYRHWLTMRSRAGPTSNIRRSITRRSSTTRRPSPKRLPQEPGRSRSRSCWRPTTSSASRWQEQASRGVAVDAVLDSVSVATTFKSKLAELGIIFCSFSEAVREHPDLVRKYLGSVVPSSDNFFAALNSAVFTDG